MRARSAPAGAPPAVVRLFEALERLRGMIVSTSGDLRPDPCSWQQAFLQHALTLRDDPATAAPGGAAPTCLMRLSSAVRRVEELRNSRDPILAGPEPADPRERSVWRALRNEWLRPLEDELDSLLESVRGEQCAELRGEAWPPRFVACLTACERYFDDRGRKGEYEAANREMARAEWEVFLAAAEVIEAIAAQSPGEPPSAAPEKAPDIPPGP